MRIIMHLRQTLLVPATLTRMALALVFCWLCVFAGAAPAWAEISISIASPGPQRPVEGDPLEIAVIVLSPPAEITSIQAAVGTRTLTLTKGGVNSWLGSLSMAGLPSGQYQLVVTATNVASETQQATRAFIYDSPPTLTVTAPAENYTLSGTDVRVRATCVDDGGSCKIGVRTLNGAPPLAVGIGTIDTIVTPRPGLAVLAIEATDAVPGRATSVLRYVDVLSPRHRPVASYSGHILDITPDRALIFDGSVTPSVVRLVDRATNTSQIIWTSQLHPTLGRYEFVGQGFLTVSGALLETQFGDGTGESHLREWRGGALTDLGVVLSTETRVKGAWATYILLSSPGHPLMLRNLLTGTSSVVTDDWNGYDVAPDGRVFYSSPSYEIMSFAPGPPASTTQVTFGSPAWSMNPKTDGSNIVFRRLPKPEALPGSLVLRTSDGAEIVLADPALSREHHVNNGWIVFVRRGDGFAEQLWRRAPDGTERQLAVIDGNVYIWGLSDTGEVIFELSGFGGAGGRYLARPDGTVVDFPPGFRPILFDGAWHQITTSHLLAVDMTVPSRSILAEGATGTFFTTDVAILNPHDTAVPVTIRYLRENAPEIEETRTLPPLSRTTIRENAIAGLEHASVSTVVDAPGATPVVVERLMTWDASGYGGHLGTSVNQPRSRWLFAEGAQGFFHTYFLLANSGDSEAEATFTFLVEAGTPVAHTVRVAPGERKTIYTGDVTGLINRSFATVIDSNVPIVAERAMYFGDSPVWLGGHGSAGVPELANAWYHAEGATGSLFDTFILLANPHPVDVPVRITYTTDAGNVLVRSKTLPASSRLTINLEDEGPELANAAVATRIQSLGLPFVSERAMYWGTTGAGWREAHNSFGVTQTGVKWGLAEGRSGGPRAYQTFVLVSNPGDGGAANLRVTFVKEDGTTVVRTFDVAEEQRFNIDTSAISQLANSNFSTIVESMNGVSINVESAIYWSVNGVTWEGGGNTVGTRLQ
jgi:hypothetical protein